MTEKGVLSMKNNNLVADVKNFWKQLAVRERLILLVALVVISLTHGILGTLLSAALIVGFTYVLAMFDILQRINWRSTQTQRAASLIMIFVVVGKILGKLGVFGVILQLVWLVVFALLIAKYVFDIDLSGLRKAIKEFFENL